MKRFIIFLFLITTVFVSNAQQPDTSLVIENSPKHSPTKATILSLALPGLGQAYNKKYWKIPIVYGLIGTSLYFALDQQRQFEEFKSAYIKRVDKDSTTIDTKYLNVYTDDNLIRLVDYHRKNRDLFFVLTGVAYTLNVLDAAVDAHLYYFDVSDDLQGSLKPSFQVGSRSQIIVPSITLSLKFNKDTRRQSF